MTYESQTTRESGQNMERKGRSIALGDKLAEESTLGEVPELLQGGVTEQK